MPKKYNIHAKAASPRFTPLGKSAVLDWEGGCLRCFRCVKRQCIYDAYNKRTFDITQLTDTIDNICKNCLWCVQMCPGQVITKIINPEYKAMGDIYWTPDIITSQWNQAATGAIPVSGAGYAGPFSGPGFDAMWTDMSEIVRPTRDGIHGREYINTSVYVGKKLTRIIFDKKGKPTLDAPANIEIPVPLIFGLLPFGSLSPEVYLAMANAAKSLGTYMEVPVKDLGEHLESALQYIIPVLDANQVEKHANDISKAGIVEIYDSPKATDAFDKIKKINPDALIMVRTGLGEKAPERVFSLHESGADIIHVYADRNGNVKVKNNTAFVKDELRRVHDYLVDLGVRENITIIASGGIAMAEHVAKAIICGADAVAADVALLLALECRVCLRCEKGLDCPVEIENIHPDWGGQRIINLMCAWRNQILEVLGAMGIREIRRLRGEVGRAMFFEDLEAQTFGMLFGEKKKKTETAS